VVRQNEDLVAIDAELVGWGNGVRYGRGTNAAHYSRAGHQCGAAAAVAPYCGGHFGGLKTPLGVTPSRSGLKRKLPSAFSAILLFVGSIGWCWPVFNELRSPVLVSPAEASIHPHISRCQRLNRCRGKADSEIGKLDPFRSSTYAPSANPHVTGTSLGPESPARIVAREPSSLRTRVAARGRASAKHAAKEPKPNLKVPVRLASLERAAPRVEPSHTENSPKWQRGSLVDHHRETAGISSSVSHCGYGKSVRPVHEHEALRPLCRLLPRIDSTARQVRPWPRGPAAGRRRAPKRWELEASRRVYRG
jgi:hypothetical protein